MICIINMKLVLTMNFGGCFNFKRTVPQTVKRRGFANIVI